MSKLQELREKRSAAKDTILQMRDTISREDRDFNTEERAAWEKANKDFDDLGSRIDAIERGDAVAASFAKSKGVPGNEDTGPTKKRNEGGDRKSEQERLRELALEAFFLRTLDKPLTDDHRRACKLTGFRPSASGFNIRLGGSEQRAQSVGTNSAGGFTVPTGFVTSLEVAMKEWNAVRQSGAEVMRTESGNPLPWPTINDTGNAGVLLTENAQVTEGAMTFGSTTFNAYKFSSNLVLVSAELDEDNAVGLSNRIAGLLGERIGRSQEGYFTTGTGSSQPGGVVTGSTLGKTGASATAIAADELIDLYHSVDPAYRRDKSFGFMCHDLVAAAIRKLKDGENRYLWEASLAAGEPESLLGRPLIINQSMASSIAASAKTVLAGAFSAFKIRDVRNIRVVRMTERYADYDQTGFVAFARADAKVLNAGTNPIKHYIQAAS